MRSNNGRFGFFAALAVMVLAFGASPVEAQLAEGSEKFVGKWTVALEAPSGGGFAGAARGGGGGGGGGAAGGGRRGPMIVDITQDGDKLVAQMTGGMGGDQTITNVRRSGENLILNYSISAAGQSIPVTLRFIPDGEQMKVDLDFAGQMSMPGTATKD
jgi:hypothetical protein